MARKFKKNGQVNFQSNTNINQSINGNLQITSPNIEVEQILINRDNSVSISVTFYETAKNSNPAIRTFEFQGLGAWVATAFLEAENEILAMSELTGATEQ